MADGRCGIGPVTSTDRSPPGCRGRGSCGSTGPDCCIGQPDARELDCTQRSAPCGAHPLVPMASGPARALGSRRVHPFAALRLSLAPQGCARHRSRHHVHSSSAIGDEASRSMGRTWARDDHCGSWRSRAVVHLGRDTRSGSTLAEATAPRVGHDLTRLDGPCRAEHASGRASTGRRRNGVADVIQSQCPGCNAVATPGRIACTTTLGVEGQIMARYASLAQGRSCVSRVRHFIGASTCHRQGRLLDEPEPGDRSDLHESAWHGRTSRSAGAARTACPVWGRQSPTIAPHPQQIATDRVNSR